MKHLFSRIIVIYCVIVGTVITAIDIAVAWRTGDASQTGVLLAFWGGELLLLCLKRILAEKDEEKENENETEIDE